MKMYLTYILFVLQKQCLYYYFIRNVLNLKICGTYLNLQISFMKNKLLLCILKKLQVGMRGPSRRHYTYCKDSANFSVLFNMAGSYPGYIFWGLAQTLYQSQNLYFPFLTKGTA